MRLRPAPTIPTLPRVVRPARFGCWLQESVECPALLPVILALAFLLFASGCGFGTAGVGAAVGKDRSRSTSITTVSGLRVEGIATTEPKVSPARIRFTLADEQSDPASVEFFYTLPLATVGEGRVTALQGLTPTLTTSPAGIEHTVDWQFVAEPGIPTNGSLIEGVTVMARVGGGTSQEVTVRLGNDAPSVGALPPHPEVAVEGTALSSSQCVCPWCTSGACSCVWRVDRW